MKALLKRKLLVVAVAAALLGGGAVAVAATRSVAPSGREAYLADVAKRLGVSTSALKSAMQAAGIDRIEAAVAAGKLTPAQANSLKQRIREGRGPLSGRLLHAGARGGPLGAAARYLGLTPLALRAQRAAGKSLGAIAAATPGKSAEGLSPRSLRLRRRDWMRGCLERPNHLAAGCKATPRALGARADAPRAHAPPGSARRHGR